MPAPKEYDQERKSLKWGDLWTTRASHPSYFAHLVTGPVYTADGDGLQISVLNTYTTR